LLVVTAAGSVAEAFDRLQGQGADGAIVLNEASALTRAADSPADLRLVVVDGAADDAADDAPAYVSTVSSDHAAGAAAATAHLLRGPHANVHHLAGPADSFAAAERERGWRETLKNAGIEAPHVVRGDWSAESGYAAASALERA